MAYETLQWHTESRDWLSASYSVVDTVKKWTPWVLSKSNQQSLASILDDVMFISRNNSKLRNLSAYVLSVMLPEQIREDRELVIRCLKEHIESDIIYDLLNGLPNDWVLHWLAFFNWLVTAENYPLEEKVDYIKRAFMHIVTTIENTIEDK